MLQNNCLQQELPFLTILHSLQNSVISSSDELKSRAHTGEDAKGALKKLQGIQVFKLYMISHFSDNL